MSVLVVVLLGGLWALILLPGAWRDLRYGSPLHSVDAFEQSMSRLAPQRHLPGGHVVVLGRPDGTGGLRPAAPPAAPAPPRPVASRPPTRPAVAGRPSPRTLQRRRQVLAALVGVVVVTGIGALWRGGLAWGVFLLAYAALFGYLALLAQLRSRRDEARAKLAYLSPAPARRPLTSGVHVRSARGA